MSYSIDQYRAAEAAACKYLTDRREEDRSQIYAEQVDQRPHLWIIDGTIDIGELITAALDGAHPPIDLDSLKDHDDLDELGMNDATA